MPHLAPVGRACLGCQPQPSAMVRRNPSCIPFDRFKTADRMCVPPHADHKADVGEERFQWSLLRTAAGDGERYLRTGGSVRVLLTIDAI